MRWISVIVLAVMGAAGTEERELKGHVTDDMCGAEHMMDGMNAKECADECVKMGAAYALFVPSEEKMYLADDAEKLKPYAGEEVVVKGSVSADGKTVTVASIERTKKN
jgi:hypothetical protein